jgi:hypothetical protein
MRRTVYLPILPACLAFNIHFIFIVIQKSTTECIYVGLMQFPLQMQAINSKCRFIDASTCKTNCKYCYENCYEFECQHTLKVSAAAG